MCNLLSSQTNILVTLVQMATLPGLATIVLFGHVQMEMHGPVTPLKQMTSISLLSAQTKARVIVRAENVVALIYMTAWCKSNQTDLMTAWDVSFV